MDVIAIATYLFYSLGNGRIPFYSDIVHSLSLLKDIGVEGGFYAYAVATVTLQIVLLFSLFFSAQCFLRQNYLVSLFGDSGVYAFCYRKLFNLRNTVVT